MRDNEPENYADISDASGTLLLDVGARDWSEPMLKPCGLTRAEVPQVHESYEKIGTVLPSVAAEFGLPAGVVLCADAGDNAAAAIGTGCVGPGSMNVGLGTSGTVFIPTLSYAVGVGGILGSDDFAAAQEGIDAAVAPLDLPYFLPYLMGERTPHNDTAARGSFVGMSMSTTCANLTRAVLEGVAFAVRDSVEIARALGVDVRSSTVCGGAKSRLWLQMLANILNIELKLPATEQGPGYGGAMLAGVAAGAFEDVAQACEKIVAIRDTVQPDPGAVGAYDARYLPWHDLYPSLKSSFAKMGA